MTGQVAVFLDDLAWVERERMLLDEEFYPEYAHEGRFVPLARSSGSIYVQLRMHIDCIVASKKGGSVLVEEKLVRWPRSGKPYEAIAVETHSNFERTKDRPWPDGWIYSSQADCLLYGFQQEDGSFEVWLFSLPGLRDWFIRTDRTVYSEAFTDNGPYSTRCLVVPLSDIPDDVIILRSKRVQRQTKELANGQQQRLRLQ